MKRLLVPGICLLLMLAVVVNALAIQPPQNLYSVQTKGGLKLMWATSVADSAVSYNIYRGSDGAAFSLLATLPSSGTTYTDQGYSIVTPNFTGSLRSIPRESKALHPA